MTSTKVVGYDIAPAPYVTTKYGTDDTDLIAQASVVLGGIPAGRHPCQLSKTRGIKTCRHPDHARDREQFRTALLVLGLIAGQDAQETDELGRRKNARGRCPVCRRSESLNLDGRLAAHTGGDGRRCRGWKRYPQAGDTR